LKGGEPNDRRRLAHEAAKRSTNKQHAETDQFHAVHELGHVDLCIIGDDARLGPLDGQRACVQHDDAIPIGLADHQTHHFHGLRTGLATFLHTGQGVLQLDKGKATTAASGTQADSEDSQRGSCRATADSQTGSSQQV
jgi:hypothetical protein